MKKYGAKQPAVTREGRKLSAETAWWFDNVPKAYRLYCIHNLPLSDKCRKCSNG